MSEPTAIGQGRVPRSMELYRRALELIPGGTQLVSRRPTRYANGVSPVYAAGAKGARFWDVDGHEYIDWVSGIGAIILGYCDPVVDEAVCRADFLGDDVLDQPRAGDRAGRGAVPDDPLRRDGPLRQVRRRGLRDRGPDRPRSDRPGQDPVLRLPRLARLVPRGQPRRPRRTSTPTCSPASSRSACRRRWRARRSRFPMAT